MNVQRRQSIAAAALASVKCELLESGITASVDEEWLSFSKACGDGDAIRRCTAWEMLVRNSAMPGATKIVLRSSGAMQVIAEAWIESVESLPQRIRQAIDDLREVEVAHDGVEETGGKSSVPASLEALCSAAGWDFHRRGDGRLPIALDVPASASHALLAWDDAAGCVHATVDLCAVGAESETESEESRQAAAICLLQLGGIVRLVRPALGVIAGGREVLQLQSRVGPAPSAMELHHALCALSVACRIGQREIAALLGNESLASRYLALGGWSAEALVPA